MTGQRLPTFQKEIFAIVAFLLPAIVSAFHETLLAGDVYVEGVFSLYSTVNNTCVFDQLEPEFVQNMESIRWTLDQLNKDAIDNMYGTKIGLRVHTTCRSESSAETVGMDIALNMRNSSDALSSVAVIGPDFSSEAEALSRLLSSLPEKYRLLQLGFDTTSASLKDKTKFRNFFRTIPPDNIQVKVMNLLVQELNWTYMAIIYDNDSYGINGVSELVSSIRSNDVCFPYKIAIHPSVTNEALVQNLEAHLNDIIIDSRISGVLVFGSLTLGMAVLNATDNLRDLHSNFTSPVFLFSESSSYFDGDFERVSRGAFAMSPPRKDVQEFTEHWVSLFANVSKLNSSNSFIKSVYESVFSCKLAASSTNDSCSVFDRATILEKLKPSLYNQYAIQATMLIAKAVKEVHKAECGPHPTRCDKLTTVSRQKFIDVFNHLNMNFYDEFLRLRIIAFRNPALIVKFNGSADAILDAGYSKYEVYNHQKCQASSAGEGYCFAQVATLSGDQLTVNTSAIKDYNAAGEELKWPNIRKSQCPDLKVCMECLKDDNDDLFFVEGDIYIVGIMPVHGAGSSPLQCGNIKSGSIDFVESLRFAIEDAQLIVTFDAKVGFIIIDSCNDPQIIQEKVLSLHRLGVYKDKVYIPVRDKILGYIGGWSSDVSIAVAEITSRLGYVQISYSSTAPGLSSRTLYPFFLRTATPDEVQADTMLKIVSEIGVDFVQILYSKSAYGEGGRDMIIDAINDGNYSVCVAQAIAITQITYQREVIESINQQPDAKVILMFVSSLELVWLLPVLNDAFQNSNFLFIASEEWGVRTDFAKFPNLKGSITLSSEIPVNKKFVDHLKVLKPDGSDSDPWLRPYMEHTFDCYYEWSYNKSSGIQCSGSERLDINQGYTIDAWAPFVEKAVLSLLLGAHPTLQKVCDSTANICELFNNNTALLVNNIRQVEINDEYGRPKRVFNGNGDGLAGYNIYTVTLKEGTDYEQIGSVSPSELTSFLFYADRWHTHTGKSVTSICGNQPVCQKCFPKKSSKQSSSVSYIAVICVLGLACCVIAGLHVWFCYRHGTCIRKENGKLTINCFASPNTYDQSLPKEQQEDHENYDIIREVGAGSRYQPGIKMDIDKRSRLPRPDSMDPALANKVLGGADTKNGNVKNNIQKTSTLIESSSELEDYMQPVASPTAVEVNLDEQPPKGSEDYMNFGVKPSTGDRARGCSIPKLRIRNKKMEFFLNKKMVQKMHDSYPLGRQTK